TSAFTFLNCASMLPPRTLRSTSLRIRKRLGDDLVFVLVDHIADAVFVDDVDMTAVRFENVLDHMHLRNMLGRCVTKPRNTACVASPCALRSRGIEARRLLEIVVEPIKQLTQRCRIRVR